MPRAIGIHDHPTKKLGVQPPTGAARLRLRDYLKTTALPVEPVAVQHFKAVKFGLDDNDRFGVCGPTGLDNLQRLVSKGLTGKQVSMSQDHVFELYTILNPGFDPSTGENDNGVILQDMLAAATKYGYGGIKPLAYAAVDPRNDQEMNLAVALFGGVLWGATLQVSQQSQSEVPGAVWDYSAPHRVWGGHCMMNGQYTNSTDNMISWAQAYGATKRWRQHQLQEAWVVLYDWHFKSKTFLSGVNVDQLATDYNSITGSQFKDPRVPTPAGLPRGESAETPHRHKKAEGNDVDAERRT